MRTVLVSVSAYHVLDHALGLVEPKDECVQHVVDYDDMLSMIALMASVTVAQTDVVEIDDDRVVVAYDYNLTHMLRFPRGIKWEHEFGWLYAITPNETDPASADAIIRLGDMLMADHRHIIVPRVALKRVRPGADF